MKTSAFDHRRLHDDENAELSAFLHTLDPEDWDRPSLCAGWRVRDVVGHILDGNELRLSTLPLRLARFGFSSDRSGKHHSIQRAEGRDPAELLRDFDRRDPWAGTGRVFPPRLVLLDRLAHHQDIRRALGHLRTVPERRLLAVLEVTPKLGSVFGARRRTRDLRFEATDVDFTRGDGPVVRGPGEALFMAMLGRDHALADLGGEGIGPFRARLAG
ncbi:maleylpyruvate isomerase family mycothiol-dependent enzyme [soil metagenome]